MFGSQQLIINFSVLSILPIIIIFFYIYKRDKFPEPPRVVFLTFLLGCGIALPLYILIPLFEGFVENIRWGVESYVFFQSFIRAAFLEESMKYLVLILFCLHLDEFDEPMDAIIYGVAVSLGFALFENYQYVIQALDEGKEMAQYTAFIRAFTAIPLHAICGIFMGFFLMDAVFKEENKEFNLFFSLFFPISLHGLYDYILMSQNISRPILWISILLITFIIRSHFIFSKERKLQAEHGNIKHENKSIPRFNKTLLNIFVSLIILIFINYSLNYFMF